MSILLPATARSLLLPLGATRSEGAGEHVLAVKLFTPWSNWSWYAVEGGTEDGDFVMFGYVVGQSDEWGYFSLVELESIRGPAGLRIERDLSWTPRKFDEAFPGRATHGEES